MVRLALVILVLGYGASLVSLGQQAARETQPPKVFTGQIKDVKGSEGTLTLTQMEGTRTTDRTFPIKEARIVGLTKSELKIGSLRPGDWIEIHMAADSKTVQEIRLVPPPKPK